MIFESNTITIKNLNFFAQIFFSWMLDEWSDFTVWSKSLINLWFQFYNILHKFVTNCVNSCKFVDYGWTIKCQFMAFMEKTYGNLININLYWTIFFQTNLSAAVAMAFQNYNHKTRWFSSLLDCSPQYIQQACNTLKSVSNKFFVISLAFFCLYCTKSCQHISITYNATFVSYSSCT